MLDLLLNRYLENHCDKESPLLEKVRRETHLKTTLPRMVSGHVQGRFLSLVSKLVKPKNVLEIGTFTGYATLCLAEGLAKDGQIHTIDINEETLDLAKSFFDISPYKNQITSHLGAAEDIIKYLPSNFDLVFIDADKKNNNTYYQLVIEKLVPGGLIIIDNVLWRGKVYQDANDDKDTRCIRTMNEIISGDSRVEKLILPLRDGVYLIRKKL